MNKIYSKKKNKLDRIIVKSKKNNNKNKNKKLISLSNMAPLNQKSLEAKYCSCIKKVRKTLTKPNNNPYGICTNAVFSSRNTTRDRIIDCEKYYDYSKMTVGKLREIARDKKISKYSTLKKKELIKKLENYKT